MYPVRNAHAPYCHLRPARIYNIFFHIISKKGAILRGEKKVIEHTMCFDFLYQFFSENFLILK